MEILKSGQINIHQILIISFASQEGKSDGSE